MIIRHSNSSKTQTRYAKPNYKIQTAKDFLVPSLRYNDINLGASHLKSGDLEKAPCFLGGMESTVRSSFRGPADMRDRIPELLCQMLTLPSRSLNVTRVRPLVDQETALVGALCACSGVHLPLRTSNTWIRPSSDPTATCWVVLQ